jgi:hypothetical protein
MTPEEEFAAEEAAQFPNGNGKDHAVGAEDGPGQEAMPELPDGIGMDPETVRLMLVAKFNTMVGKNDPLLMMVTILNVFLAELEKINNNHNGAVTKIMSDQSAQYITGVKQTTDALGKVLAENTIDAIQGTFNSHTQSLNINTNNAMWCAGIMAISALVNVALMAIRMWGG